MIVNLSITYEDILEYLERARGKITDKELREWWGRQMRMLRYHKVEIPKGGENFPESDQGDGGGH